MITYLRGKVIDKEERAVAVEVGGDGGGIGYKIFVAAAVADSAKEGAEIALWTHLAVREDAQTLFGFPTKDELSFFELLISVSGIGPKTALGILNVSTVANLRKAISTGETSHLTKVSGIGKKIADKIVLELKGKLGAESDARDQGISLRDEVDALEALKALGYGHKEAREALKEIDVSITNAGDRVKRALKVLGK
ncbi:MAG: Holliday junction branch migration protein RuvA [Patescibacteria group bacterium]|nr:Holliday junction branch migration protein RuvA [Patescibacteria group bacterium]MDE2116723.1 Holliday junction branch migration protein RuvA [Patescibacteria group bacterium]